MRQALIRQRTSALKSFAAPVQGWIANTNLAINPGKNLNGAYLLENWFPTATGAEVRRGSALYATLGGGDLDVTAIFDYNNGNIKRLFASTETTVYDITNVTTPDNYQLWTGEDEIVTEDGDNIGGSSTDGLNVINGMSGGSWITTQFATTGGVFLVAVNGEDPLQLFDGSEWFPIDEDDVYMLLFDAQTDPFFEGQTLTGATSGATGFVLHVEPTGGATGILYITDVTGTFQNNEIIDGTGTADPDGSATADGVPQPYYVGITGVDTSTLSYVWSYKNRLYFIQRDSFTVWYLDVDSISGTATAFPMGGEFSEGGKLLMGSSWSLDSSGDGGLSEQCVFISDEGQVVAYQGFSPAPDQGWSRVGGYKIGKPLGPLAYQRAGGDLIIATDIGYVPLSQAVNRDVAALSPAAVSYPIETEWNATVEERRGFPWHCAIWPEKQMVIVGTPTNENQTSMVFAANARTGAWTKFTGWDVTCLCVFDGRLFYGTRQGKVIEAYITGLDQGSPYTATFVPMFNDFGNPASLKIPKIARARLRGANDVNPQLSVMQDYVISLPAAPAANPVAVDGVWDGATWNVSTWGGKVDKKIQQAWTSVSGMGYALAASLQITSGSIVPIDTEIIDIEVTFEITDIVA